ncbi:MAG: ParB/RepB/Spo0J family partition protein [Terriglobia bacterium]
MKRRALGKGLSSLIPQTNTTAIADSTLASSTEIRDMSAADINLKRTPIPTKVELETRAEDRVRQIDVLRITPNPSQPRQALTEEQLAELVASIKSTGLIQPILVRPDGEGGFQVVAGERRWRAAQRAGLETIPAMVKEIPDNKLLEVALIENIQRQELNPMEEARAYRSLQREQSLSQEEVADRVGKQRSTVANVLRLLKLPSAVQKRVETGVVSMGHARALLGLLDPAAQESICQAIEEKGLSVRLTEQLVRKANEPKPAKSEAIRRDPNVIAAEDELCRRLETKVRILQGRAGRGRMIIEFYSEEELDRIYEVITRS